MSDHIKMPAVTPLVRYLANGEGAAFSYPFPIFASEDLAVYLDGARQISGFDIAGAGDTSGGTVTFDEAPAENTVVTLAREISIERMTDFLEGGDFSANSINNELDYLVAAIQQVERENNFALRYNDHETTANVIIPARGIRANKALGFNADGDPVAVSLEGSMAAPDFTATGTGASTRTSDDKFSDFISVKDFGAIGDGLTNDTIAIQNALAAHDLVYIPPGEYLINATIQLSSYKKLMGAGQSSIITCQSNGFNAIEIPGEFSTLSDLRINGGAIGIKLFGGDGPCVQNNISDVTIFTPGTGILLDGGNDGNKPCYWNNFFRVLVEQPATHGVHLTKTGAGDTPNANKFHACRVYSHGVDISGAGFYVEHGAVSNAFVDCEANIKGTGTGCFIVGPNATNTWIINFLAESNNVVPNIKLESGSSDTSIINLLAASNGAAIWDLSGGQYTAYNAGWPNKNRLQRSTCIDMTSTLQRYDTEFIDTSGTVELDLSHSVHLVSSYAGALNVVLPKASDAMNVMMVVKKIDISSNVITITEDDGDGPDAKNYYLGAENDFVMMMSNGAEWFVISSSRSPGNSRFHDGTGTYDLDMAVDVYLLSSFSGALTARLPPADAPEAVGRTVTIKKIDSSANDVTVAEQGGAGPDQSSQILGDQYDAITVLSDGNQWFVLSRY
jgi:hypothetical protein